MYWLILVLVALLTAPWPFVGGAGDIDVLGVPLWLWWSGVFTVLLSVTTFIGIRRTWQAEDD